MAFHTLVVFLFAAVALVSSSVVQAPGNGNFELLILHNNDMHARFEQTSQLSGACTTADREAGKCYGGFPRVAHVVKEARKAAASGEGPPVLYLNAGDTYTGTAWFTIYKWKVAAEFLNALQPDAVSLGNHEFDNGVSGLTPFIENLKCPVLAANLILNQEPSLQAQKNLLKSITLDINGTKIGIIGYLTPDTKILAIRNNVEYIDEEIAIRNEIAKLKMQNVKIFIALGHSGYLKDLEIAKIEDLDLVIGGHTNTFLWDGKTIDTEKVEGPYPTLVKQTSGKLVPVVQAYAYTKYLGKLRIIFNSSGDIISFNGNPILLDNSVPQDTDILDIVKKYREDVAKLTEVVVGKISVVLDGQSCRLKECNMGNMITDAMIHKYASGYVGEGWTDAPIAIIQGGGIRASIAHPNLPSNVTKGDLLIVTPFDGNMVRLSINGSNVWKMLEHSVAGYLPLRSPGEFLQFSGLKVEYDFEKPPGIRVKSVSVRCGNCYLPSYSLLNRTKVYNILMSSFLSRGGGGFSVLIDLPTIALDYDELQSTIEYIQNHKTLYPAVEGRIVIHNADKLSKSDATTTKFSFYCILFLLLINLKRL